MCDMGAVARSRGQHDVATCRIVLCQTGSHCHRPETVHYGGVQPECAVSVYGCAQGECPRAGVTNAMISQAT